MTSTPTRPSADPTRAAIIAAARQCFANKGYAGTSISTIAKNAIVNQSLIYHHFGSKHELWIAVKVQILEDYHNIQDMNWDKLLTIENSQEFVAEIIRYRFGLFDRYPDTLRIIEWQYLEPDPFELSTYSDDKLKAMVDHIQAFQQQKQMKANHNAELILSMLLAIPLGFFRSYRDLSQNKTPSELNILKESYLQLCFTTISTGLLSSETPA